MSDQSVPLSNVSELKPGGGGFCKYGHFVWIDQGHREQVINLYLIEAATLRRSEFPEPDRPWLVHVTTNASGYDFEFATEIEARHFLAIVVRYEGNQ